MDQVVKLEKVHKILYTERSYYLCKIVLSYTPSIGIDNLPLLGRNSTMYEKMND
jgi:hypothetical protein